VLACGIDLLTCGRRRGATYPSRPGDTAEDRARTGTTFSVKLPHSTRARAVPDRSDLVYPGRLQLLAELLIPVAHRGNQDTTQPPRPPRPSLSICCHHADDPKVAAWALDVRAEIAIHVAIRQSAKFLMTCLILLGSCSGNVPSSAATALRRSPDISRWQLFRLATGGRPVRRCRPGHHHYRRRQRAASCQPSRRTPLSVRRA
jgi:hypothetical protein